MVVVRRERVEPLGNDVELRDKRVEPRRVLSAMVISPL
jgi:hypothetical protein